MTVNVSTTMQNKINSTLRAGFMLPTTDNSLSPSSFSTSSSSPTTSVLEPSLIVTNNSFFSQPLDSTYNARNVTNIRAIVPSSGHSIPLTDHQVIVTLAFFLCFLIVAVMMCALMACYTRKKTCPGLSRLRRKRSSLKNPFLPKAERLSEEEALFLKKSSVDSRRPTLDDDENEDRAVPRFPSYLGPTNGNAMTSNDLFDWLPPGQLEAIPESPTSTINPLSPRYLVAMDRAPSETSMSLTSGSSIRNHVPYNLRESALLFPSLSTLNGAKGGSTSSLQRSSSSSNPNSSDGPDFQQVRIDVSQFKSGSEAGDRLSLSTTDRGSPASFSSNYNNNNNNRNLLKSESPRVVANIYELEYKEQEQKRRQLAQLRQYSSSILGGSTDGSESERSAY